MIRVLQDWKEVGTCWLALCRAGLPLHETPQKNWDHALLRDLLEGVPRTARVLDLGCGGGFTLGYLHGLGFRDVTGIDLNIEGRLRLKTWARRVRGRTWRAPWRVLKRDITQTGLPAASADVAVSVSVIEHGVPRRPFLAEAARVLRPGGLLFVTTDYWESFPANLDRGRAFGFTWDPFDRKTLGDLIAQAAELGLDPVTPGPVPGCGEPTVHWLNTDYTFAAVAWRRR
jgi:SAM-dependent methyltransferase